MANFRTMRGHGSELRGAIQLLPITHVNGAGAAPDQVAIMYADGNTEVGVDKQMPSESAAMFVTDDTPFKVDDIVIVTDCAHSDVLQITNINIVGGDKSFVHNAGPAR